MANNAVRLVQGFQSDAQQIGLTFGSVGDDNAPQDPTPFVIDTTTKLIPLKSGGYLDPEQVKCFALAEKDGYTLIVVCIKSIEGPRDHYVLGKTTDTPAADCWVTRANDCFSRVGA